MARVELGLGLGLGLGLEAGWLALGEGDGDVTGSAAMAAGARSDATIRQICRKPAALRTKASRPLGSPNPDMVTPFPLGMPERERRPWARDRRREHEERVRRYG
ncbi:MAG TPA: hypothetical protein VF802_06715, partial [Candidatus Limnocylindrales bacterium]